MRLPIFLVCYVFNTAELYELSRLVYLGFSCVISEMQCITTVLKIGPLFVTKIRELYDLHVLIMWYKFWQIQYAIFEFIVRNTLLVFLLVFCTFLISASYIIVRLHATFSEYFAVTGHNYVYVCHSGF